MSEPEIVHEDVSSLDTSTKSHREKSNEVYKSCRKHVGVYFVQTLGCFLLMIAALYNLSNNTDNPALWTSLLSGPLGILMPSPSIKIRKKTWPAEGSL